jgi:hypothetical protein
VTETAALVATTSSAPAPELQLFNPHTEQIQTASLPRVPTEGQLDNSESEEDTSQFLIHAPLHLTRLLPFLLRTLSFWLLMPKGDRESGFRGSCERGFLGSLCATFMHHIYIPALALCAMCACEILE